ncbi:metallophosphoesterase family protein [Deinococcus hopiensis]|uniref:Phosphoesterase, MJ0936 family n=1 Tax=Deinococcus hopiensis KR-140 TaxID=695939 RepID=A0A1W1VFD7_9DEIO|nr:metallophosphoesterase family protein [Deinococcus hopiensis]SMB92088.1 phosphoesterase, MJ0936 family [Deinococcus hopiensis KR-140]
MHLALIADIHANVYALDAVLEHIRGQAVDLTVNLGDVLWGNLDAPGCVERVMGFPGVRGNHDEELAPECGPLTEEAGAFLAGLPLTLPLEGVLCFHGTPTGNRQHLMLTVTPQGARPATPEEIRDRLGEVAASVVVCAHTHLPRVVQLPGGPLVVNPGSVGLPAYTDAAPSPYVAENFSPHARYAVLTRTCGGWQVDHHAVPYDHERAARETAAAGRPDRAHWLRTGLAQ